MKLEHAKNLDEFVPRISLSTKTSNREMFVSILNPKKQPSDKPCVDLLTFVFNGSEGNTIATAKDGKTYNGGFAHATVSCPTNFFPCEQGFCCEIHGHEGPILLPAFEAQWAQIRANIEQSNRDYGIEPTEEISAQIQQLDEESADTRLIEAETATVKSFPVHVGQETDCFIRSAGDGKRGYGWRNELAVGKRIWEEYGGTHRVELENLSSAGEALPDFADSERLTESLNSDFALAFFYIAGVLVPPMQPEKPALIGAWVDLNDVIEKIGWLAEKPNAAKREELRAKMWDFIQYGQRAKIIGERSVPYYDKVSKREISTQTRSSAWAVTDERYPISSGTDARLAPVKARVVISEEWEKMLRDPSLCQWMPLGELLGGIAPNKVGGDWARIIGLTLARLCRMKSKEMTAGEYNPTRRQLLTHYAPKTQTVESLLESSDPKRAAKYYREALNILAEKGLIAQTGDAAPGVTAATMLKPYGRQGWAGKWLDDKSGVQIGELWRPTAENLAKALYQRKPKNLKAKPRAKKRAK